jgi:hypothetical protein
MYANLAADAAFQIDLTKALQVIEVIVLLDFQNTIDRANLQTRLAPGAIVSIDNRQLLGQFFTWSLLSHKIAIDLSSILVVQRSILAVERVVSSRIWRALGSPPIVEIQSESKTLVNLPNDRRWQAGHPIGQLRAVDRHHLSQFHD